MHAYSTMSMNTMSQLPTALHNPVVTAFIADGAKITYHTGTEQFPEGCSAEYSMTYLMNNLMHYVLCISLTGKQEH